MARPHSKSGKPILHGGIEPALQELERRLAVVRDRVRGVALGHHPGLYLFGRPGTAKTFTVRNTLAAMGVPYNYHDGHLTPLGLFEMLAENHDRVNVLDDVSAIFTQPIALQILLAALSNQPQAAGGRVVQYRRQGLVSKVQFTGGMICISNLELRSAPLIQAIKSRVHYLRYEPTDEQLAALMRAIALKGWSAGQLDMTPLECEEVVSYLIVESERLGCRLDLRLLVDKAFPDYLQHRSRATEVHWKDLVAATLQEQLVELLHTPDRSASRMERKLDEQQLVKQLLTEFPTREARVAAWKERTGKSERALYRRRRELGLATI